MGESSVTDLRKRGADGTLQARVFLLLRDVGSFRTVEIARRMDCTRHAALTASNHLLRRGYAKRHGTARHPYYAAIGVRPPEDRRGKPAGSRNFTPAIAYAGTVARWARYYGPQWRPPLRGIPLEQHWPSHAR